MMESLPEEVQEQIADHLRNYIQNIQDEELWDKTFKRTQNRLVAAAQRARQEIAEGLAEPLDYNRL